MCVLQVPKALVKLPNVLGGDVAGKVLEADEGSQFPRGTRVYACTDGFQLYSREGAYCEYVSAPENQFAKVPDSLPLDEAAGLPLVSLTAWQALESANLLPGKRVLIHAGAGGVGSIAIQLAKARGAHVTTTCSARNSELCKELGADVVIDYNTHKFEEVCKDEPFDAVIDLIGGSVELRSMQVLKKSGAMVSVLNSGWADEKGVGLGALYVLYYLAKWKILGGLGFSPKYSIILVKASGEQLAEVSKLVEERKVKAVIDRKLPLEAAAEAHEYMEQGHARGKVILLVKPESK